jgi:hypothetical protein
LPEEGDAGPGDRAFASEGPVRNPEEIELGDEDEGDADEALADSVAVANPEEIGLPEEEGDDTIEDDDVDPMFEPVEIHNYPPPGLPGP